jgi:hypothetical protein
MTYITTTNFGFTAVRESTPSANDWACIYWNWITTDTILYGLIYHQHTGDTAIAAPTGILTLSTEVSGGTVPAGRTYYFVATYLDSMGRETGKSTEFSIATAAKITRPDAPTNNDSATPTDIQPCVNGLTGGNYWYKLSYLKGVGETEASDALYVVIPSDTTYECTIHFESLTEAANGADTIRVYRKIGTTGTYNKIVDILGTDVDSYTDDYTAVTDCEAHPVSINSTNATNTITIDCSSLTNYSSVAYIKIYCSLTSGSWVSSAMLVASITPNAATPILSYTMTSATLSTGKPPAISQTFGSPNRINLASETTGYLPLANLPEEYGILGSYQYYDDLPSGTDGDIAYVQETETTPVNKPGWYMYTGATPIWVYVDVQGNQSAIEDVAEDATPTAEQLKINEILATLRAANIIAT